MFMSISNAVDSANAAKHGRGSAVGAMGTASGSAFAETDVCALDTLKEMVIAQPPELINSKAQ
jgi:hypothetical protein